MTDRAYIPKSKSVEHGTPDDLFEALAAEFGPFDLDAAASDQLHKTPCYFSMAGNGLRLPWFGRVWVNPPYGRCIRDWLLKALGELAAGRVSRVVFLIPAATSTSWWHDIVKPHASEIRFLRGRLTFKGSKTCAPFASAVVVFERKGER